MKTLTAIEAQIKIIETIQSFQVIAKQGGQKMQAEINNVDFSEIIALYKCLPKAFKMLIVPGEYENEDYFTIIFWPTDNSRITVKSTPAKRYVPHINLINYN